MPTSQEKKMYAERLRQLRQLGLTPAREYDLLISPSSEAIVEQAAPPSECLLLDLQDKGALYVVWLSVGAERPGVCLYEFRFVTPWNDRGFQKLTPVENCPPNVFRLPNGWEFPEEDVLNWRFGATGWRLPLTAIEGWLCAQSATPVPPQYRNGEEIPVRIEFFGKSGRCLAETESTLRLDRRIEYQRSLERVAKREKSVAQPTQRGQSVLASVDAAAHKVGKPRDAKSEGTEGEHKATNQRPSANLEAPTEGISPRRSSLFD